MIVYMKCGDCLKNEAYKDLLDWCFHHAACFSLETPNAQSPRKEPSTLIENLRPYLILKNETSYYLPQYDECFVDYAKSAVGMKRNFYLYRCCDESKELLLQQSNSISSWIPPNPQDLCFYYDDADVLMYTVAHEGICWMSCKTKEMFNELKCKDRWLIEDEEGVDHESYF